MTNQTYQDLEHSQGNAHLYNWVFHFNPFQQTWNAIPRELQSQYWSNNNLPEVIKSQNFTTLLEILQRLEKDPDFLTKL